MIETGSRQDKTVVSSAWTSNKQHRDRHIKRCRKTKKYNREAVLWQATAI